MKFIRTIKLTAVWALSQCCIIAMAQQPVDMLPKNSVVVSKINAQSVGQKVGREKLNQLDFMKMIDEDMKRAGEEEYKLLSNLYKNPEANGIDATANTYGFVAYGDSTLEVGYVWKLVDRAKFENFLNKTVLRNGRMKMETEGKFSFFHDREAGIIWNDEVAQFVMVNQVNRRYEYFDYPYDAPDYDEKREAFYEERRKRRMNVVKGVYKNYINNVAKGVAKEDKNFATFNANNADASIWATQSGLMRLYSMNMMGMTVGAAGMMMNTLQNNSMMSGAYQHILMTFNNGVIDIETKAFNNADMAAKMKGLYAKRVSPEFLKYLKGQDLMGFYSMAIDTDKIAEVMFDIYAESVKDMPQFGKQAEAVIRALDMIIDQQDILSTFRGDMMFAVTGMKEFESTYTSYEYDEDYNYKEVTRTRKETLPEFVAMIGKGKKKNIETIMQLMTSFEVIKLVSDSKGTKIYEFTDGYSAGIGIRFIEKADMLMVTNNTDITTTKVGKKGYKKKQQVDSKTADKILNNAMAMNVNFQAIFKEILKDENMNKYDRRMFDMFYQYLDKIEIVGVTEDATGVMTGKAQIFLKSDKENSMIEILNFINNMVINN